MTAARVLSLFGGGPVGRGPRPGRGNLRVALFAAGLGLLSTVSFPVAAEGTGAHEPAAASVAAGQLLDVNTATPAQLAALPGLGPKRAEAIVAARTRRPFSRLTQLLLIRGIGPRVLRQLKGRLAVGPTAVLVPQAAPGADPSQDLAPGRAPAPALAQRSSGGR